MAPTNLEIEIALANENEALKEFALATSKETAASLKVKSARCKLQLARRAKNELLQDLITYSK